MIFNHEAASHSELFIEGTNDPEFYTKNNFENFKNRYIERINNFRNYLKNSNDILFIYESYYQNKLVWNNYIDVEFNESKIKEIITKIYGDKNISFLNITKN